MVVKDSNRDTFIGNVTAIPSGKRWVFQTIYKHFFLSLYGEVTISGNRLALTNNDMAEWGPLDNVINTVECWKGSVHMLCTFHALTMSFFEKLHLKLPHMGSGKNRKLTVKGKAYLRYVIPPKLSCS